MAQVGQEQSLKKQLTIWFRKNEKLIWVGLLVVVCFSFGMTGVMEMVMGDRGRNAVFACDGRTYTWHDLNSLNSWLVDISRMSQGLDYRQMVLNESSEDEGKAKDLYRDVLYPFVAAVAEADRLGIEVSPAQMFEVTSELYTQHATSKKLYEDPEFAKLDDQEQNKRFKALKDATRWDPQGYQQWLRERGYSVPDFEYALGLLLKVDSLRRFYLKADVMSRKDLFAAYVRENRTMTIEIAKLDAEHLLPSVSKDVPEAELAKYYNDHKDKFFLPTRVRFSYLKVPLAHFESQVTPTDEELRRKYDSVKVSKYLKDPLQQLPTVDYPLTPDEQAKLNESLFKPFEEVKDEVRAEYVKTEGRTRSRAFGAELGRLLNPPPPPPAPAGQSAPETPKPKTPQEITAQYAFLQAGETELFSKDDAEKVLGELYVANNVTKWLKDLSDGKPLVAPISFQTTKDGATLFLVCALSGEKEAQLPFEKAVDQVKKAINMEEAMRAAGTKAGAAIGEIRNGTSMAAALPGARVEKCGPLGMDDCINPGRGGINFGKVTLGKDTLPREIEAKIVMAVFSEMKVEDKIVPQPIEDLENKCYYLVRIAEEKLPDAGGFSKDEEDRLRWRFRSEQFGRQYRQWPLYLADLVRNHIKDMIKTQ